MNATEIRKGLHCVAEVQMTYRRQTGIEQKTVRTSRDVYDMALEIYEDGIIDYSEQAYVLLLNQNSKANGYRKIADGGLAAASVDIRMIMQAALLTNSTAIAFIHNHPSGNIIPSKQDDNLTRCIKQCCDFMNINMVDHVIVTREGYYSYADHGRL